MFFIAEACDFYGILPVKQHGLYQEQIHNVHPMVIPYRCRRIGIGQGAVGSTEFQTEGNALTALRDVRAAIDIEQCHAGQQFAGIFGDALLQLAYGDVFSAHNGKVAGDRGELGQRFVDRICAADSKQGVKAQLSAVQFGIHAVILGDQRMDLAEGTDEGISGPNCSTAAGVVGGIVV